MRDYYWFCFKYILFRILIGIIAVSTIVGFMWLVMLIPNHIIWLAMGGIILLTIAYVLGKLILGEYPKEDWETKPWEEDIPGNDY